MFRIPEVRFDIRRWFCWPTLTVSLSELIDVMFSCVLLHLTVDYVLCAFLMPKFLLRFVGARASSIIRRRQAPVGSGRTHPGYLLPTDYVA